MLNASCLHGSPDVHYRANHPASCALAICLKQAADKSTMCIVSVLRFCLLLMLLTPARGIDIPITCDAGTYAPGQTAFITCNLYDSVRTKKLDVTLVRYPFNVTEGKLGKDIMTCRWQEGEKKHWCNVKIQGYELDHDVNMERPTVIIRSVSDKFAGLYICSIITSDGPKSHGCQLTVQEGWKGHTQLAQATHSNCAGDNSLLWIIVLPVLVAVGLGCLVFFLWRKIQYLRRKMQFVFVEPFRGNRDSLPRDEMNRPEAPNVKVQQALQDFDLSDVHNDNVMRMCLKPGTKTTIKMSPTGQEQGDILVIDFNSAVLKIELVKLHEPQMDTITESHTFPSAVKKGTGKELFSFIAEHIDVFAGKHNVHNKDLPMALVFSFPCNQGSDFSQATLTKWSNGFECNDILGEELGLLLQAALQDKNPALKFKIKVIVNDAVGTLVSAAASDPKCKIALILDNGFNVWYVDQEIGASNNSVKKNMVIVKIEWGSLGDDGCLERIRTSVDRDLDELSRSQGQQTLEKMVSRMYIGEIVRLVLLKLISEGLVFKSNNSARTAFSIGNRFRADFVSLIESDTSNHYLNTKFVLRLLGVEDCKEEDWKTVRYVCQIVSDRAANLASAALAKLINLIGRPGVNITIAVEGSLNEYHPHFHDLICSKTNELVKTDLKGTFKMVSSKTGSNRGAALLAATSS